MEQEVVSRQGPAAAHLVMVMLHFKPSARPSVAHALHLPFFSQQPQEVPHTGGLLAQPS